MTQQRDKNDGSYLPRAWGAGDRPRKSARRGAEISDELTEAAPEEHAPEPEQQEDQGFYKGRPITAHVPGRAGVRSSETEVVRPVEKRVSADPAQPLELSGQVQEAPLEHLPTPATKPAATTVVRIAGIRFGYACKIYDFDAGDMALSMGDWAIVKSEKGAGLGQVAREPFEQELDDAQLESLRRIVRKAGKSDFDQQAKAAKREIEAYQYCQDRIQALGLPMKLVSVECFFDGSKYVFFFTAEGRVDFRELVKQLVARFPVRIEMRQIGVRHEAKMVGGLACCGQELCCSRFLVDFKPVSVRMAKTQNLSLNPSKISGVCGRLMCCLGYEHEIYEDFRKGLPKAGKTVKTPRGEGVVVKHNPLSETVCVRMDEETVIDFPKEQLVLPIDPSGRPEPDDPDDAELPGDSADFLTDDPNGGTH